MPAVDSAAYNSVAKDGMPRGDAFGKTSKAVTLAAIFFVVVALHFMREVLIPLALPDIYSSLRNLFGLAFGYIMLAELVNAEHGLGYLLMSSQRRGLTEHIFAILIVIGLLAYGIDRLLFWFQRGLFPHRTDHA